MKTVCILKDRSINNYLPPDRKYDYLFTVSCPSNFKTFKFDGNIEILSNGINYSTINITPNTYIAKVYPDMRINQTTDSLCEFEFSIEKEALVNKNFDNASNIIIFGKFGESVKGRPLNITVDIKSIEVQM